MRPGPLQRGGWVGASVRILAYVGLLIVIGVTLGVAWQMLPAEMQRFRFADAVITAIAALVAGLLLIRFLDHRSPAALGVGVSPHTATQVALGLAIGAGALAVAAGALLATGSLQYASQEGTAAGWLRAVGVQALIFTIAAFAEEALFRGYAFQVLTRAAGVAPAVIVSSALFALAHGANPSVGVFALINIFLAGILLAAAYLRTLSLWFATALHMGWNWAMATLFDLPVSGLQMFDTPLYEPQIGGAGWWSGGAFGPEGGAVGTIGFGVALVAVWRWHAVRPDPATVAARPLVLQPAEEAA